AQQADMDRLLSEQQDRSSPSYHKWLTPEQYAARFGMTPNDLAKVTSWLQSQGLRVNGVSRSRTEISFSGSVGQVEYALKTELHNSDIDAFRRAAGLSVNDPTVKLVPNSGTLVHSTGDETEADLDLEWAGGIAPNANIIYYTVGNSSNSNVFDSLNYAVQQNAANVISISYGNCEAKLGSFILTLRQWAQQANAQGQTISGPSGDDGAADCDSNVTSATHGLAVDIPAAIPEVTGVG